MPFRVDHNMFNPDGMMPMLNRGPGANIMATRMRPMLAPSQNAPQGVPMRPGLFGGIANALRTAGRNYMSIDPQTRMMMGAGMMQGGLPGLAQGMLSGQELLQKREDRAFTLAERERAAAERVQAEAARAAMRETLTPEQQRQFDINPTAYMTGMINAQFREPTAPTYLTLKPGEEAFDPVTGRRIAGAPARAAAGGGAQSPAGRTPPPAGMVIRGPGR